MLPEVLRSDGDFGATLGVPGLPDGMPIAAVLADSHAALFGHGCTTVGHGEGHVRHRHVGDDPDGVVRGRRARPSRRPWPGSPTTPTYAREGNILSSGATLAWAAPAARRGAWRT